ncbi:tyrosine-type recombinase/integrase [Planktomarina temperata]|nr:tyrosine-type recombinase/integrase [Planktomarina temperata]
MLRDATAKAIKPTDKPIPDGTITGLRLHSTKTKGRGAWKLRFVSPETGERRDMGLGVYPHISINEARRLANKARSQIALGIDPISARTNDKKTTLIEANILTFADAAEKVFANSKAGWKNKKHQAQWINTLRTYVFPNMGHKLLSEIDVNDVAESLRPIWLTKAETASRVKQRIHHVLEWACAQQIIVGNPVNGVKHLLPKQPSTSLRVQNFPAMPWRIIPRFVVEDIGDVDNVSRNLLLFVILTAVRSGEARKATWSEFDLKQRIWTIPASRMKAQAMHRVPLSGPVLKLLEKQQQKSSKRDLVFPSPRAGGELTDMALTSFLRKHRAVSDTLGRSATAHGFRSSFRDWASENGYPRDYAERALAHTIKDASEAAYHRTDLLEQRRPMMENWAKHVISEKKVQSF